MFNAFKMKLMMLLVALVVAGGILTKTLPISHNVHTIRKLQAFNVKEKNTKDVQNIQKKDVLKDSNLPYDEKSLKEDNINKQPSTYSKLEDSNPVNNPNTKKSTHSQLKESSNIGDSDTPLSTNSQLEAENDMNQQEFTNSQSEDINSNVNTDSQDNKNVPLEKEIPTIHYDRTTSIYANDNITLLRIEYYVNNKLTYYSVIEQFDATTKSYVEKIYQCNRETNIDPLIRTDIYANGNLIKSY